MALKQKTPTTGTQVPAKRAKTAQSEHVPAQPLTTEQEEDLSSALIAKLLAEESGGDYVFGNGIGGLVGSVAGGYYAEYNNETALKNVMNSRDDAYMESEEEEGDDDYAPGRRGVKDKKRMAPKMSAQRKKKQPVEAPATEIPSQSIECSAEQTDAAGTTPEKGVGANQSSETPKAKPTKRRERVLVDNMNTGVYTEEEEKRFLEGLELHGRCWKKLVEHMDYKRDAASIRSHAQKHFIKLYRDNLTLPAKVAESGYGYTLSGKPLDPESSAAKPYLVLLKQGIQEGSEVPNPMAVELNRRGTDGLPDVVKPGRKQKTSSSVPLTAAGDENAAEAAAGGQADFTSSSPTLPSEATQGVSPEKSPAPNTQSVLNNGSPGENVSKDTLVSNPPSGTATAIPNTEPALQPTPLLAPSPTSSQAAPTIDGILPQSTLGYAEVQVGCACVVDSPSRSLTVPENPTVAKPNTSSTAVVTSEERNGTDENKSILEGPMQTDYSKNRPRRAKAGTTVNYHHIVGDVDPLSMVKCESFAALPNSGLPGAQPFAIEVNSNVLLFMDLHAHLMTVEIIGFLAGKWDPIAKRLEIRSVFPCRSLPTGQDHVNVEMDPTSECEVRARIREKDLQVVGWYHSHPTFAPDPSLVDLENQTNYQRLFRDEKGVEAFVGVIVGPYDPRLPGPSSVVNWFYLPTTPNERGTPKRTVYELKKDDGVKKEEYAMMLDLIETYRHAPERAVMTEPWRPGDSQTRLEKLRLSLAGRLIEEPTKVRDQVEGPSEPKEGTAGVRPDLTEEEERMSGAEFVRKIGDALTTW